MAQAQEHGTRARYFAGCRCEACRIASRDYMRGYRAGCRRGRTRIPLSERFWAKVDRRGADECWEWKASRRPGGYGQIQTSSTDRRPAIASRVSWELHNGPIPEGAAVMHRCDNPPCVNPAHLELGTRSANNRDMAEKGRHVGSTRLTPDQVAAIRSAVRAGDQQKVVAARFGISQSHVSLLVNDKRRVSHWGCLRRAT